MKKNSSFYLNEMDKISLLTQEEEKVLIAKVAHGDRIAREKLINANLRYVVKVANVFKGYGNPVEDLIEAGNIGLIKAVDKVDPESNTRFITYASWWIKACIQEEIANSASSVRLPGTKRKEARKEKWNFDSLDRKINGKDGESTTLENFVKDEEGLSPEEQFMEYSAYNELYDNLENLDEIERIVMYYRNGLDGKKAMSLQKIGNELGYTKEGIRNIEKRAIEKLKKSMKDYTSANDFLGCSA